MVGAYLLFDKHIDGVSTIAELGSRDGEDAVRLRNRFDAKVVAFECNPHSIPKCRQRLESEQNIRFVPLGVWDENTNISFYPVVNGNIGASSAFKANHDYPYETPYKQEQEEVQVVRLEDWWKENEDSKIDLLCMDLQGSELKALHGAGDLLHSIDYIISEIQYKRLYEGTPLYSEIKAYLESYGLVEKEVVPVNDWFGDALFVRE